MSYIDTLRLAASNAGSSPVTLTGQQLTVLLDAIAAASGGGGGGLAATGLDNGATVQDQPFLNGVVIGSAGAIDGVLNVRNSADSSFIAVSSTAAKQLKIDNVGHDTEVGINGAAVIGMALKVVGQVNFDSTNTSDNRWESENEIIIGEYTGTRIVFSGSNSDNKIHVFGEMDTSAGLTVGGGALIVPIYADSTARDNALPTPSAGMLIYNADAGNTATGALQIYTGAAAWETVTSA